MSSKKADIRIQFKDVPGDIFKCVFQISIVLNAKTFVVINSHANANRSKAREERVCHTLATFGGHVHEANCKSIKNQRDSV